MRCSKVSISASRKTPDGDGVERPIRLAVAGRPNVGKSTLINTWLGEERLVAFDQPGTTRDAIHVPFERAGQKFELIDTAGLRRKGKVFEAIEKFSVVKTLQAIADANVVLLLLDATQGVTDQDAHIAGYILDSGRAVVIAVNKWDAIDSYQREMLRALDRVAPGFPEVRHRCCTSRRSSARASARSGRRSPTPMPRQSKKMPTPVLTRLLHEAVEHQAPKRAGHFRPKLRYAHQGGMNPPIVVDPRQLARTRDRQLQALPRRPHPRAHFKLVGTPLRIEMQDLAEPFRRQGLLGLQ